MFTLLLPSALVSAGTGPCSRPAGVAAAASRWLPLLWPLCRLGSAP